MGISESATLACLGVLLLCLCAPHPCSPYPTFSPPGALFNHSAVDPVRGTLYLGAVNRLYQLTGELEVVSEGSTGPVNDSRECAPPIQASSCPQARPTAVYNKLLLFDREGGALLVCGSAHQGLCEKRAPGDVGKVLEREAQPGETQYVAADDPETPTVGVVGWAGGRRALFVGRGYTHRATDAPISTRRLEGPHPFSNEEMGRLAVGAFAEYDHRFAAAFARGGYVYFVFSRRAGGARRGGGTYQAYAARICANDTNYYSYVEVPLACHGPGLPGEAYGLVQASALGRPGGQGATPSPPSLPSSPRPDPPHQAQPSDLSALCVYPLADIDSAVERARVACYSSPDTLDARVEYNVKSSCTRLRKESIQRYPCGGEHTPSPIASRIPLDSLALLTTSVRLTAVAVAKEMNHTVLFLGDRLGQLHKVFLRSRSEALTYSTLTIQRGASISQDLFLDPAQDHLYVLTSTAVTKVPVSECSRYSNCSSCLGARDPYCGWCVLDGRCCRNLECARHKEANQWLWHYNADGQCLTVHSKIPANLSREAQTQVTLTIERLPRFGAAESLSCSFGGYLTEANILGREVTCLSPEPVRIPGNDPGKDHVRLELALRFGELTLVSTEFVFYDCRSLTFLQPASSCRACVTSEWNCKWCLESHLCTYKADCKKPLLNQNDHQSAMRGPDLCPYVERIEGSPLIPVGQHRALKLIGWNLNLLEGEQSGYQCVLDVGNPPQKLKAVVQKDQQNHRKYIIDCQENQFQYSGERMEYEVDVFLETEFPFRIDSLADLKVTLYNCAIGRPDCSRCQVTEDRFGCVWCGTGAPSCVYRDSCHARVVHTCPLPDIQQIYPLTAPIEGGTAITITGANLGQRAADIQRGVTVAGLPCLVEPTLYRASARIVCRVSASNKETSGAVTVTVRERTPVTATHTFTYQ
ncbi:LOW QUALITY PROTEIN: plexin-B3-like, partial [Mustelus asterias]